MAALDETAAAPQEVCPDSPAQTGDNFRKAVAAYPDDDPRELASAIYWARGALPKDIKRRAYVALKSLAVMVEVARKPEGVLGLRTELDDQSATEGSDAALSARDDQNPNPPNGEAG